MKIDINIESYIDLKRGILSTVDSTPFTGASLPSCIKLTLFQSRMHENFQPFFGVYMNDVFLRIVIESPQMPNSIASEVFEWRATLDASSNCRWTNEVHGLSKVAFFARGRFWCGRYWRNKRHGCSLV